MRRNIWGEGLSPVIELLEPRIVLASDAAITGLDLSLSYRAAENAIEVVDLSDGSVVASRSANDDTPLVIEGTPDNDRLSIRFDENLIGLAEVRFNAGDGDDCIIVVGDDLGSSIVDSTNDLIQLDGFQVSHSLTEAIDVSVGVENKTVELDLDQTAGVSQTGNEITVTITDEPDITFAVPTNKLEISGPTDVDKKADQSWANVNLNSSIDLGGAAFEINVAPPKGRFVVSLTPNDGGVLNVAAMAEIKSLGAKLDFTAREISVKDGASLIARADNAGAASGGDIRLKALNSGAVVDGRFSEFLNNYVPFRAEIAIASNTTFVGNNISVTTETGDIREELIKPDAISVEDDDARQALEAFLSSLLFVQEQVLELVSGIIPISVMVKQATTSITVGEDGVLNGSNVQFDAKGNVAIGSESKSIGKTDVINWIPATGNLSVGVSVVQSKAYVTLHDGVSITTANVPGVSSGDVTISTQADLDAKVKARTTRNIGMFPVDPNNKVFSSAVVYSNNVAQTNVKQGASINAAGNVTVDAAANAKADGSAEGLTYIDGQAGVAITVMVPLSDISSKVDGMIVSGSNAGPEAVTFNPFTAVDTDDNTVLVGSGHDFETGDKLIYNASFGGPIEPLDLGDSVFVILPDGTSDRIQLARSFQDALDGIAIDLREQTTLSGDFGSIAITSIDETNDIIDLWTNPGIDDGDTLTFNAATGKAVRTRSDGELVTIANGTTFTASIDSADATSLQLLDDDGAVVDLSLIPILIDEATGEVYEVESVDDERMVFTFFDEHDLAEGTDLVYAGTLGMRIRDEWAAGSPIVADGTVFSVLPAYRADDPDQEDPFSIQLGTVYPTVDPSDPTEIYSFDFVIDNDIMTGTEHEFDPIQASGIAIDASLNASYKGNAKGGVGADPKFRDVVSKGELFFQLIGPTIAQPFQMFDEWQGGDGLNNDTTTNRAIKQPGNVVPGADVQEQSFSLAASQLVLYSNNKVLAEVGSNAVLEATSDIRVESNITQVQRISTEGALSKGKQTATKTVAAAYGGQVVIYTNASHAFVRNGAQLDASGQISVDANTEYPFNVPIGGIGSKEEWDKILLDLRDNPRSTLAALQQSLFFFQGLVLTSWNRVNGKQSDDTENGLQLSAALSVIEYDNRTEAIIENGALINQKQAYRDARQSVHVDANTDYQIWNIIGNFRLDLSIDGFLKALRKGTQEVVTPFGTENKSGSIGGALHWLAITNTTRAAVGIDIDTRALPDDNTSPAKIHTGTNGDLVVNADHNVFQLTMGQSGSTSSSGNAVNGALSFVQYNLFTQAAATGVIGLGDGVIAMIGAGTVVTGGSVDVKAKDNSNYFQFLGDISFGQNVGVGFSGGMYGVVRKTRAYIGSEDGSSTNASSFQLDSSSKITIDATNSGSIDSYSFAAAKDVPEEADAAPTTPGDDDDNLTGVNYPSTADSGSLVPFLQILNSGATLNPDIDLALLQQVPAVGDLPISIDPLQDLSDPQVQFQGYSVGSYGLAFAGDFSLITSTSSALAFIDDVGVFAAGDMSLVANDRTQMRTGAGAVAISRTSGESKSNGLAGSWATVIETDGRVAAFINRAKSVAAGALEMRARKSGLALAIAASGDAEIRTSGEAQGVDYAGAVGLNVISSEVDASISGVETLTLAKTSSLSALDETDYISGGGGFEVGGANGFGSGVALNLVKGHSRAGVTETDVIQESGQFAIQSGIDTLPGSETPIVGDAITPWMTAVAASLGAGASGKVSGTGTVSVNQYQSNDDSAPVAALFSSSTYTNGADDGALTVAANGNAETLALAGSLEAGTDADLLQFGIAIGINDVDNRAAAKISDTDIGVGDKPVFPKLDITVDAQTSQHAVASALGFVITKEGETTYNVAGSAAATLIDSGPVAEITGGSIDVLGNVSVTAKNKASEYDLFAARANVAGDGENAFGASIAYLDLDAETTADISDVDAINIDAFGNVKVDAETNETFVVNLALGGQQAQNFAAGGSVAVTEIDQPTTATISNVESMTLRGGVDVSASLKEGNIRTVAGDAEKVDNVFGASVAVNTLTQPVHAQIDESTITSTTSSVNVNALDQTSNVTALTLGGALASADNDNNANDQPSIIGFGSVSTNTIKNSELFATITGSDITAHSGVGLDATRQEGVIETAAGLIEISDARLDLGASVATNTVTGNSVRASIDTGSDISTSTGSVSLNSDQNGRRYTAGAAGLDGAASVQDEFNPRTGLTFGGSIATNTHTGNDTLSYVLDSDVSASNGVSITADDSNNVVSAGAGELEINDPITFGAAVATNTVNSKTWAYVQSDDGEDHEVKSATGQVELSATRSRNQATPLEITDVFALSIGGIKAESVAFGGSVSTNTVTSDTHAYIDNTNTEGSLTVSGLTGVDVAATETRPNIGSGAGEVVGSKSVAIGAAVATNTVDTTVRSTSANAVITSDDGSVAFTAHRVGSNIEVGSVSGEGAVDQTMSNMEILLGASVSTNTIDHTTQAKTNATVVTAKEGVNLLASQDDTNIGAGAGNAQFAFAKGIAIGGSVVNSNLTNTLEATAVSSTLTATSGPIALHATTDADGQTQLKNVAVSVGGAGAANDAVFVFGGSYVAGGVTNNVDAAATSSTLKASSNISLDASQGETFTDYSTGTVIIATAPAVGASVTRVHHTDAIHSSIQGGSATAEGGSVDVQSDSSVTVNGLAAGGVGAKGFALGGSVVFNTPDTTIASKIDGGATVSADGNVTVSADNDVTAHTIAGELVVAAFSGFESAPVSLSIANATLLKTDNVSATVGNANVTALANKAATSVPSADGDDRITDSNFKGLSVTATSTESMITVAASAEVDYGGTALGIAASVAAADLDETTLAIVTNKAVINEPDDDVSTGSNQRINVFAYDETTSHLGGGAIAFSFSKSANAPEAGTYGVGAGAVGGGLRKSTQAVFQPRTADATDNILVQAMSPDMIGVYAGAGGLEGTVAIAGALSVFNIDQLDTYAVVGQRKSDADPISTAVATDGSLLVHALESLDLLQVAGALDVVLAVTQQTKNAFGVGAAANVGVIRKRTEAYIGVNAAVDAKGSDASATVAVSDGSFDETFDTRDEDEVEIPEIDLVSNANQPDINDQSLTEDRESTPNFLNARGVAVGAVASDDVQVWSFSLGAGVSKDGVSLLIETVVGWTTAKSTTDAHIADGAKINLAFQPQQDGDAGQSVHVAAADDFYKLGVVGTGALAVGQKAVALAPGFDRTFVEGRTRDGDKQDPRAIAYIGAGAEVYAQNDVLVNARATEDVTSVSAGVSAAIGNAGIDVEVNVAAMNIRSGAVAYIGDGATVVARGNVLVEATDDTDVVTATGGLAIQLGEQGGGAGASVSYSYIGDKHTTAYIGKEASVTALGLGSTEIEVLAGNVDLAKQKIVGVGVQATSSESLQAISVAGAVGSNAGIAGAVSWEKIKSDTTAYIADEAVINGVEQLAAIGTADPDQSVNVSAGNVAKYFTIGGGLGISTNPLYSVELAGGVDIGIIQNNTLAYVGSGAEINASKDVDVFALSDKGQLKNGGASYAFAAALGLGFGIAGANSNWAIQTDYNPVYRTIAQNVFVEEGDNGELIITPYGTNTDEDGEYTYTEDDKPQDVMQLKVLSGSADLGDGPQFSDWWKYIDASGDPQPGRAVFDGYDYDDPDGNQENLALLGEINEDASTVSDATAATVANAATDSIEQGLDNDNTKAIVETGALIRAGADVTVDAKERVDFAALVGEASLNLGSIGGSVALVNVNSEAAAQLGGTVVAGGNVSVSSDYLGDLDITAFQGAGGAVNIGALVSVINDNSHQSAAINDNASIDAVGNVNVTANRAYEKLESETVQVQVATGGAAGAVVGSIIISGAEGSGTDASVGKAEITATDVQVRSSSEVRPVNDIKQITAGIIAGVAGNRVESSATPKVTASLGSGTAANPVFVDGPTGQTLGGNIATIPNFNGDRYEDFIVTQYSSVQKAWVLFGTSSGLPEDLDLNNLTPEQGFEFETVANGAESLRVSSGSDINHDGYDDVMISDLYMNEVYVIYGGDDVSQNGVIKPSDLDGVIGFKIKGAARGFAESTTGLGNFNGDTFDDFVLGEPNYSGGGNAYVIYGRESFNKEETPESLIANGGGFKIVDESSNQLGWSVANVGNIDNDAEGLHDLFIGAPSDLGGAGYAIFGSKATPANGVLDVSDLDGMNGFAVLGDPDASVYGLGQIVSGGGDYNDDQVPDVLISTKFPNAEGRLAGNVLFGSDSGFQAIYNQSDLDGSHGFVIKAPSTTTIGNPPKNQPLANLGDVDDNGVDDFLFGNPITDTVYWVKGGATLGSNGVLDLTVAGEDVIVLKGETNALYGAAVTAADLNGDGTPEIVVAAPLINTNAGQIEVLPASEGGIRASGKVVVSAESVIRAEADTIGIQAAAGVAVGGIKSIATASPTVTATILPSSDVNAGGKVNVQVAGSDAALASGNSSSGAEIVGVFGADVTANVEPTYGATIGSLATVTAGGDVNVLALHNYNIDDVSGETPRADAYAQGFDFTLAGLTIGQNLTYANSNPTVDAGISDGAAIDAGTKLTVAAQSGIPTLVPKLRTDPSKNIDYDADTIQFVDQIGHVVPHGLVNADELTYDSSDLGVIGGLVDNRSYGVLFEDSRTIRLGRTFNASLLGADAETITFPTPHDFLGGEKVIYSSGTNDPLPGLTSNETYYVNVIDDVSIKLTETRGQSLGDGVVNFEAAVVDSDADTIQLPYVFDPTGVQSDFDGDDVTGVVTELTLNQTVNGPSGANTATTVAGIGDFNGDDYGDFVLSTKFQGRSWIVFGTSTGLPANLDLNNLTPAQGLEFDSDSQFSVTFNLAGAGDVNHDGYQDVMLSDRDARKVYVLFGGKDVSASGTITTGDLNGENGFAITTSSAVHEFGFSIAGAGDFNGDEFDDLLIGTFDDRAYLVLGSDDFAATQSIENLTSKGQVSVITGGELIGFAVAGIGNFDNDPDGLDDIIIGAPGASSDGAVVIFGNANPAASYSQGTLDGKIGFTIVGGPPGAVGLGWSVGGGGDYNDDNISDLVVTAKPYSNKGNVTGVVMFGSKGPFKTQYRSSDFDGKIGFQVKDFQSETDSGKNRDQPLVNAGDVNGDGIDELIFGAPSINKVFILKGKAGLGSNGLVDVTSASNSFILSGNGSYGHSIGAVDIDGNGLGDALVGLESKTSVNVRGADQPANTIKLADGIPWEDGDPVIYATAGAGSNGGIKNVEFNTVYYIKIADADTNEIQLSTTPDGKNTVILGSNGGGSQRLLGVDPESQPTIFSIPHTADAGADLNYAANTLTLQVFGVATGFPTVPIDSGDKVLFETLSGDSPGLGIYAGQPYFVKLDVVSAGMDAQGRPLSAVVAYFYDSAQDLNNDNFVKIDQTLSDITFQLTNTTTLEDNEFVTYREPAARGFSTDQVVQTTFGNQQVWSIGIGAANVRGFDEGDAVRYELLSDNADPAAKPIGGLDETKTYYVVIVDGETGAVALSTSSTEPLNNLVTLVPDPAQPDVTHQLVGLDYQNLGNLVTGDEYYLQIVEDNPGLFQIANVPDGDPIDIDSVGFKGINVVGYEGVKLDGSAEGFHEIYLDLEDTGVTGQQLFFGDNVSKFAGQLDESGYYSKYQPLLEPTVHGFENPPSLEDVNADGSIGVDPTRSEAEASAASIIGYTGPSVQATLNRDAIVRAYIGNASGPNDAANSRATAGLDAEISAAANASTSAIADDNGRNGLIANGKATTRNNVVNQAVSYIGAGSNVEAGGVLTMKSESTESVTSAADSFAGATLPFAMANSKTFVTPVRTATVGPNATLTADKIDILAIGELEGSGSSDAHSVGFGGNAKAEFEYRVKNQNDLDPTTSVIVGNAADLHATEELALNALVRGLTIDKAESSAQGDVVGGHAEGITRASATDTVVVSVGNNVSLVSDGMLELIAQYNQPIEVDDRAWGKLLFIGKAEATSENVVTATTKLLKGSNVTLQAEEAEFTSPKPSSIQWVDAQTKGFNITFFGKVIYRSAKTPHKTTNATLNNDNQFDMPGIDIPVTITDGRLAVKGTEDSDRLIVFDWPEGFHVVRNQQSYGPYTSIESLEVEGYGHDDQIRVFGQTEIPVFLDGGEGNDALYVTSSLASVYLYGGEGDDWLTSGMGDDLLDGGPGNDMLTTSGGDNTLLGGSDDDRLQPGPGRSQLDGGDGTDTLILYYANGDMTGNGPLHAVNIRYVDATDAAPSSIVLDAASVAALSPLDRTLIVQGVDGDSLEFVDPEDWRLTQAAFKNDDFYRFAMNQVSGESVEFAMPLPWHNPILPSDIDANGDVTSGDALRIINELSRRAFSDPNSQTLDDPIAIEAWPNIYYDQNGDGRVTALDSLRVINQLSVLTEPDGERVASLPESALPESSDRDAPSSNKILAEQATDLAVTSKLLSTAARTHDAAKHDAHVPVESQTEKSWSSKVDDLLADELNLETWL